MINRWYFYSGVILVITFLSFSFKSSKLETSNWFHIDKTDGSEYVFPSLEEGDYPHVNFPYTGNHFIGFKEAVAFKESQGKYRKVNSLGYMGKYQFAPETLRSVGVQNEKAFLKNPAMQERAFSALLAKNKWILRREIRKYNGVILQGVKITESGILAAAHLGGPGSVKNYFKNNGTKHVRDAYGTSLRSYMKDFGGYNLSQIEADKRATILD